MVKETINKQKTFLQQHHNKSSLLLVAICSPNFVQAGKGRDQKTFVLQSEI